MRTFRADWADGEWPPRGLAKAGYDVARGGNLSAFEAHRMDWFRVYDSIIDDPKILRLEPGYRWFYVALMAVCARSNPRGTLPDRKAIAIHLRLRQDHSDRLIEALIENGMIDQDKKTKALAIHGWGKRQRKSDDVYARVKRFREDARNVSETAPRVRASETERETETEIPLPPSTILGPEYTQVGLVAEQIGGDCSWTQFTMNMGHMGFAADWIRSAIEKAVAAKKLDTRYVHGILKGYQREGGPPKEQPNGVHKPPMPKSTMTPEQLAAGRAASEAAARQVKEMAARAKLPKSAN